MNRKLIIFILFMICFIGLNPIPILGQYVMSNAIVNDCEGTLSDSEEGPENGQYDHEEDYIFTICVEGAATITSIFDFFGTEADFDVLTVYDGPDINSPIIAELSGVLSNPPILVATSGCMTFHFVSDDNIVAQGWFLTWETEIEEFADPELTITSVLDCPLGLLEFNIDPRIPCDILVSSNFQLLGPGSPSISNVTPLDCDNDNTASNFSITINDSLRLSGNYNLIFNGYIVNSCGDTLTFETLVGFELVDCPFEVEIVLLEQACPDECGILEVVIHSTDPGPFIITWEHTIDNSAEVDICSDTATWLNVLVQNVNTGKTGTDEFWYEPFDAPMILNPFMSDTFCSTRGDYTYAVNIQGGRWNSNYMDNTDDPRYRFWQWTWSNGIQQDIITYTDENGCTTNDTVYVVPTYAGLDQSICLSQPSLQLTGNNPVTGIWEGPNTTPDGLFTTTIADTFHISFTNDQGCVDWKRVFVVDQIEFTQLDTICSNQQIDLRYYVNSLGGTWTGPGIDNWYHGTLKAWNSNVNNWNTYYYELDGCIDSMEIYVQGIWAGPDRALCSSVQSIQMYFDGEWSGPGIYNPVDSTYDISGVSPGKYDVYGAKSGCEDRFELTVQDINIELSGTDLFCHDAGSIRVRDIIDANPYDGLFTGEGIYENNGEVYFDPAFVAGEETYIYFEALSCTDSILVQVEQELPFDDYEFCEFGSLKTLDDMGFAGHWEGPGILIPETGLINPAALSHGLNNVYFISQNGCATTVNIDVVGFQEAEIFGLNDSYCFQDSIFDLILSPTNGIFTIDGNISAPQINPSILGPGYHEVEYVVGVDECTDKLSLFIAIDEPISGITYANFDTLCPEESTSIFVETSGGSDIITAIWDQGLGFGKSHIIFPGESTSYQVLLSDGCSEDLSLDLNIHVIDSFPVNVNYGPEVCYGDSSYIELILDNPDNYTITWDGYSSPDANYYEGAPGNYQVILSNMSSGCVQTYNLQLPGSEPLGAGFSFIPNQTCIDLINNELDIVDLAFGYSQGYLNFGETNEILDLQNDDLSHIYENIGEFDLTQIVFNELGCSDTLVRSICVENVVQVYVPTVFSPNGDGVNDLFSVYGLGITDFSMKIFDRWGNQLYNSINIDETWDGTFKGVQVKQGVYAIVIGYQDQDTGDDFVEYFDLTIIR